MSKMPRPWLAVCAVLAVLLVAACAALIISARQSLSRGNGFLFIPSLTQTSSATPTFTASPTHTATFTATATATDTPEPTATATHTSTSTETPVPSATADIPSTVTAAAAEALAEWFTTATAQARIMEEQAALTAAAIESPVPSATADVPATVTAAAGEALTEWFMTATAQAQASEENAIPTATATVPIEELRAGMQMVNGTDGLPMIFVGEGRDGFWMHQDEVSGAAYASCTESGACKAIAGTGTDETPLSHVTRDEAASYCAWAGMTLPTAEQWLLAAGSFVLSDTVNCGYRNSAALPADEGDDGAIHALWGNLWEWTADTLGRDAVIIGGAYSTACSDLTVRAKAHQSPTQRMVDTGFRCVVEP